MKEAYWAYRTNPEKYDPPIIIMYVTDVGWEIVELDGSKSGTRYTPEAFEKKYGNLPTPPITEAHKPFIHEYYAHRKTSRRGSGRGFGKN